MYFIKPSRRCGETKIATPRPKIEPLSPSMLPVALLSSHDFHVSRDKYIFRESSLFYLSDRETLLKLQRLFSFVIPY
jgi:hypothetical protein